MRTTELDRRCAHLLTGAVMALVVNAQIALAQSSFSIIALPDTQNYVNNSSNAPLFTQQTQWIADQILVEGNPRNIVFVTHLGDVVSTGTTLLQWLRADASIGVLDGGLPDAVVPYGVLPGNHDFAVTGDKSSGTDDYLAYFGPTRFGGYTWYGGAEPSGNNSYQRFTGAGTEFLHIALEWQPTVNVTNGSLRDPSPIAWAQSIIQANPGLPTIVSTHEHLDDDPAGRSSAGNALWNELIRANDQIIMVLGGHYHSLPAGSGNDGEYNQVSQNNFGNDVVEILQDYQDYPNGGDGWLRIITFDTDTNEIRVETYSPVLDQFQTETVERVGAFASQFTIAMDFDDRFQFADPPLPPTPIFAELVFRQGADGYSGTADKELRSDGADVANGAATLITIDGDDGSPGAQPSQALIRFDDIVGGGAGQIAPGTPIDTALLSFSVVNAGSGFDLYRMTTGWDESTTWAGLGGNGITPGVEALATPATSVGQNDSSSNVGVGTLALDITPLMQDWIDGGTNHGVGLVPFPAGTNGIDLTSSESNNPPALIIRSLLPELTGVRFAQGAGGYGGTADTQLREADPATVYAAATSLSVDADDPNGSNGSENHVLIRFDGIFGDAPTRIPPGTRITRALLSISGVETGDGGALHRMLQPWNDADTWATAFGGDGVQADGTEASPLVDAFVVGAAGLIDIDVTASLRAWNLDPSANFGWVILPAGDDGWDFYTSEAGGGQRPTLTVVFDSCPGDLDDSGSVGFADLTQLLSNWGPCTGCPEDLDASGGVGFTDLTTLLGAWGPCPA